MKYYVVKLLTNTQGQDAPSINVYQTIEDAKVAYHQTIAAYYNAEDVLFAVIMIVTEYGNTDILEIVDHKPVPEPTEE